MIPIPSALSRPIHPALLPASTVARAAELLLAQESAGDFVVTLNLELLARAVRDPAFRKIVATAPYRVCDGIGGKWILQMGHRNFQIPRIPGIDLGQAILSRANLPVFFLGGEEGIAEQAAKHLQSSFPNLSVVGYCHGYFPPRDLPALRGKINQSGARIVIVCMGSPRQEEWIAQNRRYLRNVTLFLPLGGSLDVWAGKIPRAPALLQKAGLEWLWRISLAPNRFLRVLEALSIFAKRIPLKFSPNMSE